MNHIPTYKELHNDCYSLSQLIKKDGFRPNLIIGLMRGGIIPAVILSHLLDDIPVKGINYSAKDGNGDNKNHANIIDPLSSADYPNILIVDDLTDSAKSMRDVYNHYTAMGHICRTAVLYHKELSSGVHQPNYVANTVLAEDHDRWIVFPFEHERYFD